MLTIHHLYDSRSERLLYCASAFSIPHQVKAYLRDTQTALAPADFKKLHPLGTAPVLQDGDFMIAESGAALIYMAQEYAGGKGIPAAHSKAHYQCLEIVHFVEGSLFANLTSRAMMKRGEQNTRAPINAIIETRLHKNMEFLTQLLGDKPFICGDDLSIADLMLAFTFDVTQGRCFPGLFELSNWRDYTALNLYADRLRDNAHYRYSKRLDFQ